MACLAPRGVGFVLTDSAGSWPYAEEIARRLAERLGVVPPTAEDHDSLFSRAPG